MRISDWSSDVCSSDLTWPIGMGKNFRGVYHLLRDEIMLFAAGNEKADQSFEVIKGIDNPRLAEMFPQEIEQLKMEVEDRKSTRLNSSHYCASRMPTSS